MKDRPEILVVDDDPNISRLEQLYLEKENYEVRTAADGNAAIAEFRRLPPDLILLDVMLPGADGYEVLKTVRRSGNIPVIMVTARGETFDKVLCLELGADDYITKPFDGKEMRSWRCCTSWPPIRTRCSRGSSCCGRFGVSSSSGTAARWTCISSACGKSCRTAKSTAGRFTPYAVWDTSFRRKEMKEGGGTLCSRGLWRWCWQPSC